MREFNQACVRVFGDPDFKAEMDRLNAQHDALCLRVFGKTGREIAAEMALAQLLSAAGGRAKGEDK